MTLFDSVQNLIFGKKKSQKDIVENDALGKVNKDLSKESELTQIKKVSENVESGEMSVKDIENSINSLRTEIPKLQNNLKEYKKQLSLSKKQKKDFDKNRRELEKQKKEYDLLYRRSDIPKESKRKIYDAINDLKRSLDVINKAEIKNDAFARDMQSAITEIDRAIRVNQKALSQNLKAFELVKNSGENVKIEGKDISEIESQIRNEDLIKDKIQPQNQKLISQVSDSQSSSVGELSDDEYWSKGAIK